MKYSVVYPAPPEWKSDVRIAFAHMLSKKTVYDSKLKVYGGLLTERKLGFGLEKHFRIEPREDNTPNQEMSLDEMIENIPLMNEFDQFCDDLEVRMGEKDITDTYESQNNIVFKLMIHVGGVKKNGYPLGELRPVYLCYYGRPKTYAIYDVYEALWGTPAQDVSCIRILTDLTREEMRTVLTEKLVALSRNFISINWSEPIQEPRKVQQIGKDDLSVTTITTYKILVENNPLILNQFSTLYVIGSLKKPEEKKVPEEEVETEEEKKDREEKERLIKAFDEKERLEKEKEEKERIAKAEEEEKSQKERLEQELKLKQEEIQKKKEENSKDKKDENSQTQKERRNKEKQDKKNDDNTTKTIETNINTSNPEWTDDEFDQFLNEKLPSEDNDVPSTIGGANDIIDDWE